MTKRLIVSSTSYETRAALLEDGQVAELFLERARSRGVAGNIYKGRVRKILPGMQSAFLDIGLEKDAFLYVSEVGEGGGGGGRALPGAEELDVSSGPGEARGPGRPIEELLREGQDLLVQVLKEPLASKGARVTTQVTLPGRYLVYLPSPQHVGVSRRIDLAEERQRLKLVVEGLRDRLGAGFIARTAAEDASDGELDSDARQLDETWRELLKRSESLASPQLLHAEPDLLDKLLRDTVTTSFEEIVVDSPRDHRRCLERLKAGPPSLVERLSLHCGPLPLFESFGIEAEIEKALRSKVWLKSGGYIVINQTEALVAIDVNTGRYVGRVTLEDTVLKTNLEAVREIVRQIRLRDLGGIIVVDFIDMAEAASRERVVRELEEALKADRSKTRILQISDFGLVEMTRKRVRASLDRMLSRPCRACGGSGRVKSPETVCYEIHRELLRARASLRAGPVELRIHPDVAAALAGPERAVLEELEEELGCRIILIEDVSLHADRFEFMPT